ncbi:MAG: glycosyltransferase [Candidatus Helarchaeota archaeon]
MKKPRITVVIPTFNEENYLYRTLFKLDHQSLPRDDYEVIIVDGESTDSTREIAEKMGAQVVMQKGKGIGGARNDGFNLAKAEIVATTDADCIVPNRWLECFIEDFRDPEVVAVTGPNGPIENFWKAKFIYFWFRLISQGLTLFNLYGTVGSNSAFRKQSFLKCGGYKALPVTDDIEIGFRIRKLGKIIYDRRTFVNFSMRRFKKKGYGFVLLKWLKGDINLFLGRTIKSKERYGKQKY